MRWCFVFCVVALIVSLSANDDQQQQPEAEAEARADVDDVVYDDLDAVEDSTDHPEERSSDYSDEESEYLPEPEALTQDGDDEEPVMLDSIVAEQLIQELDDIGNKLQDDDETLGSSRQISSADVKKLEKLLESAGLTPHSPLMQTLMNQRKNAVPASSLGPDMDGISGLRSLIGGGAPVVGGGAAPSSILAPRAMTRKHVDDIKRELKLMLFGSDQKQRRRQGTANRRRPSAGSRSKSRISAAQTRQQTGVQQREIARPLSPNQPLQGPKTAIPVFLRPPRPGRLTPPSSQQNARQRPVQSTRPAAPNGGANRPVSDIARQPISEFRQPPSDFRLPEAPFRQQVASANFSPPPRNNNNALNQQLAATARNPPPVPSQQQLPPRPSLSPRPSEEEFRLVLLSNNNRPATKQLPPPPRTFQSPPPPGPRPVASQTNASNQQRPAVLSPPNRPVIGSAGIFSTSNFEAGPRPSTRDPATRNKVVQPDCELFTDGVCLSVRNYPTELIASYLSKHRPELENMLAEVRSQSADDLVDGISAVEERKYSYSHYYGNRRQGEDAHAHRDFAEDGGFLCPSEVKYARPQLAQTSRGAWKYIINMNEHTQTIRMERCLKPGNSCSYVSPHYKSHCVQVYNYHRLLSFEEGKGMHVDIYKIPVGCSCHVQGYAYLYPPLDGKTSGHVIPPAFSTENSGNTLSRKTSIASTRAPEAKSGREDTPSGFLPPGGGMKDFASFMDQQFKGHFGPFAGKGDSNRRQDDDYIEEDPMERSASEDNERRKKTNYDYHPIIDYFHDKP